MAFGTLYLIPSTLGDYDPALVLPAPVLERLKSIKRFIVEETRTARRFLSAAGLKGHIGELELRELNEHTKPSEIEGFMNMFSDASGNPADVGLITEAGLPAVADPGAQIVAVRPQRAELRLRGLPPRQDRGAEESNRRSRKKVIATASDADIHRDALS